MAEPTVWARSGLSRVAAVCVAPVLVGVASAVAGHAIVLWSLVVVVVSAPVAWLLASPARSLVVYAFAVPLDIYVSTSLRVTTTQLLQAAILASWTIQAAVSRPRSLAGAAASLLPYRLATTLAVFLALSLIWSVAPEASARSAGRMIAAMALGAFAAEHARTVGIGRVATALCAGAMVTAAYGYAQYARGGYDGLYRFFSPFYSEPFLARGTGFSVVATFANPNILAGYLLIVIPITWALAVSARGHARRGGWVLASMFLMGCMVLTFSKASWLLLAGVAALWSLTRLPNGAKAAGTSVVALVAAGFLAYLDPILGTLDTWFPNSRETSIYARLGLWRAAVEAFIERPLLGFGLDGFASATVALRSGTLADLVRAHNMYLQTLVDLGLVGSVLLWGVWGAIVRTALSAAEPGRRSAHALLHVGLLMGAAGFFLYGLVETLNVSNAYVNTAWLVLGLLAASSRHEAAPITRAGAA